MTPTFHQRIFAAMALLLAVLVPHVLDAAVTNSITPSAISNTYSGILTFQVTGLTSGDTVVVQKFLDVNTNGAVDASDLLVQQFQLTDGVASAFTNGTTSVTNFNVPCDTDGAANGTITAQLYPSLDFAQEIVGRYLFVMSSPQGHFTPQTNSLLVTNFPFAQTFAGNVVSNGTPVSNAVVILFQPSTGGQNPQAGVVANSAGAYSIHVPPGTYELVGFKSNCVAPLNISPYVTLGVGATITTNVPLTNTTQTISGKIVDTNNVSLGLSGLLVPVQSTNGQFLTFAFTDTNGNFVARVAANVWKVGGNNLGMAVKGYVPTQNKLKVNTAGGSVSGVTIGLPKATAAFYGTVRDNLGNLLSGVVVEGDDSLPSAGLSEYGNSGLTYTNGNYVLGALSGDVWEVYINTQDQTGIYTNYVFAESASQQNGGVTLGNRQAVLQNFTGILATNLITGNVQFKGAPVTGAGVNATATIGGLIYTSHADTDTHGNYSMFAVNGSWSVNLNCGSGGDGLNSVLGTGKYQCPNSDGVVINNSGGTASFTIWPANSGQIYGYLTDVNGNGISGITIFANDGVGDNYYTTTTNGGYYSMIVTNGSYYDVSVSCYQLGLQNFYCVGDDYPSVANGAVEADFMTTPMTAPVYAFTNLHSFLARAVSPNTLSTNSDGYSPLGGLLLSGNALFGTAQYGGTNGAGTIFSVGTNLSNFTIVHTFSPPATNRFGVFTNADGGVSGGGLVLSSNVLYGTAVLGGLNGNGTVFAMNTNGTGYFVLHTFAAGATNASDLLTNNDGANPYAALVLYSNVLYGTVAFGCTNGTGCVFALNTNGSYSVLHTFSGLYANTNNDGANPYAGLLLSGGTLYGTAALGGSLGYGTVFAVNTNGTGFNVLYNFSGGEDGGTPYAGLVLVSNLLYGVTSGGGHWASGALFAINTNGTGFSVLHSFAGGEGGAAPYGGLIFSNNMLYGTTAFGGTMNGGGNGNGTVFGFNLNSLFFTVLYTFSALDAATMTTNSDGAVPYAGVVLSGNTLYGTTTLGGSSGNGTVYAVATKALPSSPILSAPTRLPNHAFQLLVAGQAGETYTILVNTNVNMTNWYPIFTTNPAVNTFLYTDPNATNAQRIYRIMGQ